MVGTKLPERNGQKDTTAAPEDAREKVNRYRSTQLVLRTGSGLGLTISTRAQAIQVRIPIIQTARHKN